MNMLPSPHKSRTLLWVQSGRIMPAPTGRFEKRTARAVAVEIRPKNEGMLKETALTENVSPHGARVFVKREWRPGQPVVVFAPEEGVWSSAQIVYCHRFTESRFAVGLELYGRVEQWARPF